MLRRAAGVRREICKCETGVSTEDTTLATKKIFSARAEGGVPRSIIVDFTQESFEFLGFRVSPRKTRQGKPYPLVEPRPESCKKMRAAIGEETTRSALWKEPAEVFKKVNQRLRGWSNDYHYGNSTKAFSKMQKYTRDQMRRWLWKKHEQYTQAYSNERLHTHDNLYSLPLYAAWKHS